MNDIQVQILTGVLSGGGGATLAGMFLKLYIKDISEQTVQKLLDTHQKLIDNDLRQIRTDIAQIHNDYVTCKVFDIKVSQLESMLKRIEDMISENKKSIDNQSRLLAKIQALMEGSVSNGNG